MKKVFNPYLIRVCLILLLAFCESCGWHSEKNKEPVLTSINIIDREGFTETISGSERLGQYQDVDFLKDQPYQKVLRIYSRDQCGDVKAYITSYHPNGQPKQYLEVLNNRAFGTYREWYQNGFLKLEAFVIGGTADIHTAAQQSWLFEGEAKAWNENGGLQACILYAKGELQGYSTYYHCNGKIWKRIPYDKNLTEGRSEVYLEDGQLFQSTDYYKGKKQGESIRYWSCNKIAADEKFCDGLLMEGRYYDLQGNLQASIVEGTGYRALFGKDSLGELHEYHGGLLDGEVKIFGTNCALVRINHLKNDIKHGEEIEYYETVSSKQAPRPKLSINWAEGKIQGVVRTWYPNGVQESQREISNNMKSGMATAWYRDGSLMLIEEYDRDKLMKGEYYRKGDSHPISEINGGKGLATLFDSEGSFLRKIDYNNSAPVVD